MVYYKLAHEKEMLEYSEALDLPAKFEQEALMNFQIDDLEYIKPAESTKAATMEGLKQYQIAFFKDEIKAGALAEAYLVNYVQTFKEYKFMSTARLALGLRVMREAARVQNQMVKDSKFTKEELQNMLKRLQSQMEQMGGGRASSENKGVKQRAQQGSYIPANPNAIFDEMDKKARNSGDQ
jgi:hypothetical protein